MNKLISSIPTRDLVSISWSAPLEDARCLMDERQIRHLPVLDDGGDVVGVISDGDLQRAVRFAQPDRGSGRAPEAEFDANDRVRDWMSWPTESIDEGASVIEAARTMVDKRISCLLVARGGELVGIVTTIDLLRAWIADSEGPLERAAGAVEAAFAKWPVGQIANALSNAGI